MTTFTFPPSNASLTEKPRVVVAKFGDGYEQRTAFGLNTNPQSWSLTFANKRASERDAINQFPIQVRRLFSADQHRQTVDEHCHVRAGFWELSANHFISHDAAPGAAFFNP